MQLRSDIQIATLIRALKDVVMPAIDPGNRLAVEQGQLMLGMLNLMQQQLPMQFRFDRDELRRLVGTAQELEALCAGEPTVREDVQSLTALRRAAAECLAACGVDPAALHGDVMRLRQAIGSLVTAVGDAGSTELLGKVERQVLDLSREQLLRDRSLLAPQGWEPGLPAIGELLAQVEASVR